MLGNCPVIALEEHYWDEELSGHFVGAEGKSPLAALLKDVGETRLRAMDEAGIDMQVLSHGAPAAQKLSADMCVDLTRRANERLAETCARQQRVAARRKALVVCSVFTLAGLCFAVLDLLGLGASVSSPLMSVVCLSAVAFETVAWVNERRSLILGGVRVLMR